MQIVKLTIFSHQRSGCGLVGWGGIGALPFGALPFGPLLDALFLLLWCLGRQSPQSKYSRIGVQTSASSLKLPGLATLNVEHSLILYLLSSRPNWLLQAPARSSPAPPIPIPIPIPSSGRGPVVKTTPSRVASRVEQSPLLKFCFIFRVAKSA